MTEIDSHSSLEDDHALLCHPYMLACNASIVFHLTAHLRLPRRATVLDLGAGTGQVCRLLAGVPGLSLEACDFDSLSQQFFRAHPELRQIPFHLLNVLEQPLPKKYDAIVARGVYHHIPKTLRPSFLRVLWENSRVVIIADEGISEYRTLEERSTHLSAWYGYVIGEAEREGLTHLAASERRYWKHEALNTADDGGDLKESPTDLLVDAREAGLQPPSIERYGPWTDKHGGFYTATFLRPPI
ncbi:MAG: class I SAM-dependent methyltransferase [Planctomycetes bacterium]|nr:class I SAM-dependent methyltransferase [Planctomycetota bacterium]